MVWIYHSLFKCVEGYLDCFQILHIMNKAAMSIHIDFFVSISFHFSVANAQAQLKSHMAVVFRFLRNCQNIPRVVVSFYIPVSPHPCQYMMLSLFLI